MLPQAQTANAREVYETAMQEMDERDLAEEFFVAFAQVWLLPSGTSSACARGQAACPLAN